MTGQVIVTVHALVRLIQTIVLIKQLYVDVAGKNFTVTKMGRMKALFL